MKRLADEHHVRSRRWRSAAALIAGLSLVLAVAGCGGGSDEGDAAETTEPAPETTTTVPEEEPSPAATDFSAPGAAVIAHRGASAYAPEHTYAAYDLAVEQDADYLEQDVQLTADGELVVLHDPSLDRTARGDGCTGPVSDKTVAQLQSCEVGSWFNEANPDLADPAFAEERIPTLAGVFDRYGSDVRYYIEVKAPDEQPGMEEALLELLDEADIQAADQNLPPVVIQSFSAESLKRIHQARPELPLVQLISATMPVVDQGALDEIATYAVAIGPAKALVNETVVALANERCLDVHPYTVEDPEEMFALLNAGVGGMFTNSPDALVEARQTATPDTGICPAPATAAD